MKSGLLYLLLLISSAVTGQVPTFNVSVSGICTPVVAEFTDVSTLPGTVVKRIWDFGDGNSGTFIANETKAQHNYIKEGEFPVTLTLVMADGTQYTSAAKTIVTRPTPVAAFDASAFAGCPPLNVVFKDLSTTSSGAITKWQWDFGDGSSTLQNPDHTFTAKKNYPVSLIVYNEFDCKSEVPAKNIIRMFAPATASFKTNINGACDLPVQIKLNNTTTGSGEISYLWSFGDGEISTEKNPVHSFTTPGAYNINLTVNNGTNCGSTTASSIIYAGTPGVAITSAPSVICTNNSANFQANASPSSLVQSVSWYFPDDNLTMAGASVNHTFNSEGTYIIKVKASSAIGCVSPEAIVTSVVKKSPLASFSTTPDHLCRQPFEVKFSNTSAFTGNNYEYNWNFGDGQTSVLENPSHTYVAGNSKYVTFSMRDKEAGCESPVAGQSIDIKEPAVNLNLSTLAGCKPVIVQALATASSNDAITAYQWDWGDNSSSVTNTNIPTHLYVEEGSYTIKVAIATVSGCTAVSDAATVVVADGCKDDGSLGADNPLSGGFGFVNSCANKNAITFTDEFSNRADNNYKVVGWDFGDGSTAGEDNPVLHVYTGNGTREYIVKVTRRDELTGDIITSTKTVVIIDEKASFSVTKTATCTQKSISFKPGGLHPEYIKQYKWDFGDGTVKTINNTAYDIKEDGSTTHLYSDLGEFFVSLIVTDKFGCTSKYTYPGAIHISGPKADFEAQDLASCKESEFTRLFVDKSTGNESLEIEKWDWYVWRTGDNPPATPTLSYSKDNIPQKIALPFKNTNATFTEYSVKLVVTDVDKCKSTAKTLSRYIKSYWPEANFTVARDSMCGNRNVSFSNISATATATPGCLWSFGDGKTATTFSPSHLYEDDGKYTVKLIVTEQKMPTCSDTATKENFIKIVKPTAAFEISDLSECPPIAVNFTNTCVNAGKYTWTFDDGISSAQKDITGHIYAMGGDYTLKLQVEGIDGCTDEVVKSVHIKGPSGRLEYEDPVGCAPFTFQMQVADSRNVDSYSWDFGDGSIPTDPTASVQQHIYTSARKYLPNVIITSDEGCHISLVKEDSVIVDKVYATFQLDSVRFCGNGTASVKEVSAASALSEIELYKWKVNDELISEEAYPAAFNCKGPGEYNVSLTATSKYGCEASTSEKVNVYKEPVVSINGAEVICLTKNIASIDYSPEIDCPDAIETYKWLINDSLISTNEHADVNYRQAGIHDLKLIATTINGCIDSSFRKIIIDSVRAGFATSKNAVCGESRNIFFINTSTSAGKIADVKWDFGDENYSGANDTTSHNYNQYGDVKAALFVATENGCVNRSDTVTIHLYQSPTVYIKGKDVICLLTDLPSLQYSPDVAGPDAIGMYKWLINDSSIAKEEHLLADYRKPGAHDLKLIATTILGCVDSSTKRIIIDSVRAGFATSANSVCGENRNIFFANTSTVTSTIAKAEWDFGDGNYSVASDTASHNYDLYGDVKAVLSVTTENGCVDRSDTVTIHLYQSPIVNIKGDNVICLASDSTILNYTPEITSAGPIHSYSWLIDGAFVSGDSIFNANYRQTGKHDLMLISTTDNGCSDSAMMTITIDSVNADFFVLDSVRCGAGNVKFVSTSSSVFPIAGYLWRLDDSTCHDQSKLKHYYAGKGNHSASLQVTTENNCSSSLTKENAIEIYENPTVELSANKESCLNMPVDFIALTSSDDKIISYQWMVNNTPVVGVADHAAKRFSDTGNYIVSYKAVSEHGCTNSSSLSLIIHPLPSPVITPDTIICRESAITLRATGTDTYVWNSASSDTNAGRTGASLSVKPLTSTTYYLTATNKYNCSVTDSVLVKVDKPVDLKVCDTQTICKGAKAHLLARANTSLFLWDNSSSLNNSTIATPIASPVKSTAYNVTGVSGNACPDEKKSVMVNVVDNPTVSLGPDITVPAGNPVTLQALVKGDIKSYLWNIATASKCISCQDVNFIADHDESIVLQVFTQEGCTASDTIAVHVLCNKEAVYIPTAFTPNGDGINDIFYIKGHGLKKIKSFRIFDRWGKLVFYRENFTPNDIKDGWNGMVGGRPINQSSTFVYVVDAICQEDKNIQLKGTVLLMR